MSTTNPTFKTKNERNEFYIALAVIALFALFFWWTTWGEAPVVQNPSPEVVAVVTDTDGDGVVDSEDKCPNVFGDANNAGCPEFRDADNDGIADADDKCPKYFGTLKNNGCPIDTDGDGVHDGIDKCPSVKGPASNKGCLLDSDGDGVADVNDKCPNEAGTAANSGCPKVKIEEADLAVLTQAMKSVEFETGKSSLKATSYRDLDQIASMMSKYKKYKLTISGHTDNVGDASRNLALSKARAKTCYDYLVSKGVKAGKMNHKGYGQKRPKETNDTPAGREANRRVEFTFDY